jgi:hypothetical protein
MIREDRSTVISQYPSIIPGWIDAMAQQLPKS